MTTNETKWHLHKPGDPMPVDGETVVEVRYRNGVTDVDRAGQYSWDYVNERYSIIAYRYAKPADEPQPAPERRWISVAEQPHPVGEWFFRPVEGGKSEPLLARVKFDSITHWHPMEQPPEFVEPPVDPDVLVVREILAAWYGKTMIEGESILRGGDRDFQAALAAYRRAKNGGVS